MTGSTARVRALELGLPDEVGVVARLVRLDQLVRRVLADATGPVGIAVPDFLVLSVVRHSPGGRATPSRICEVLDRTSGGMSLALDRLVAAGLLRRSADPEDRRRVVVEPTPEGLAVAARVNADLHAWEQGLGLTDAQRRDTDRVVDRLLDLFEPDRPG